MRGLISDLLDAGRIEAGTLTVTPEPAALAGLVEQARNTFLNGGGRHTVQIDLPPDLPRVLADRRRIVQVLNNLFSNAARYSPESSPIQVTAHRDGLHVAVSVSDEGRGLPVDRMTHLFRKFSRIDGEAQERGIEGSGLGLAICKGLVEAHGGRIWAESGGEDRGSRFTFTIPVAEEPARGAAAGPAWTSSGSRRAEREQTRILVVDDDPQTLRYVRDALTEAGYSLHVTGDPEEVPRLIETHQPHLILLDLMLPGTDGIELMERVPAGRAEPPEPYRLGDLAIHYEERRVIHAGREVKLTATEYELLRELSVNAGRVLTHDDLLRRVWGSQHSGDARLVRAFVKKIRRKLGDDASRPAYILTEPRVGYRMAKASSS